MHGEGPSEVLVRLVRACFDVSPDQTFDSLCDELISLGARHASVYVVDYDQVTLQPIAGAPSGRLLSPEPVGGSLAGVSFLGRRVEKVLSSDGNLHVWAPVLEHADRMGVVELALPDETHPLLAHLDEIGLIAGQLLHSVGRYTDRFELLRRRQAMNLAAEMQWSMLLPALTLETPSISVASTLEPAYEIGGDAFDYAVLDHQLHMCVLDAMGHGVGATMTSALTLGAYRFGRRQGMDLSTLAAEIDLALDNEWGGERFVTGHLAHLDADTGELGWINAGHPPPLLIRGGKVAGELECAPCRPFGLGAAAPTVCHQQLASDDRVLFYTDGAIEARVGVDQLGLERFSALIERELNSGHPDSVVLRRLVGHVTAHIEGKPLADDLTLVLLHWHPRGTAP